MRALVVASLVLLSASVHAQTGVVFNRAGSGARAAGMANAFIAVSDDGTAASWNPAGLAQLRLPELSIVSTTSGNSFVSQNFRTLDGSAIYSPARSAYQDTYLDFTSLALPVTIAGKPVSFQAAWRRQYELDFREVSSITRRPVVPDGPPLLRIDDNHDVVGSVDLVSLAAAARLTGRLSLGGSVNLWRGDWTETGNMSATPGAPGALPTFTTFNQTNRVRGENLNLGLMLTYPRWSVGVLHQMALRSDYSGRGDVTSSDFPGGRETTFEGILHFPRALGVGAAFRPAARWTVALDVTRDEWRDAYVDVGFGPESMFDGLPKDRTSARDTTSVNAGAERLFVADGFVIPLRFGVAWEPQGWSNPYTRDHANYVMWAVGSGYNTNSVKLDVGFQMRGAGFQDGIEYSLDTDPQLPDAVGRHSSREWRVKFSLILRLQDPEKLRGLVGKIF
jgi:long-subunit fatty acid transport protein